MSAHEDLEAMKALLQLLHSNPDQADMVRDLGDSVMLTSDAIQQAQADTRRIVAEELADLKAAVFAIGDGLQHLANHLGLGSRSDV